MALIKMNSKIALFKNDTTANAIFFLKVLTLI